jgi:pyruvate formate lyase activating enzyme
VSAAERSTPRPALRVGGFTPFSLSDWPDRLAAVVFCQGCPWRCAYCHNPHLIAATSNEAIEWPAVVQFLRGRQGLLDAVVFSGGEPTAQPGIVRAIAEARALGFKIGLHTSGAYPRRLARLLPTIDWVAMDIKAPFDEYEHTTGACNSGGAALASARAVLASGVACEFRTTVHPLLLPPERVPELARSLAALGVRHYALQEFRPQGCEDAELNASGASFRLNHAALTETLGPLFSAFCIRHSG